jgi:multiple sugar transport system ATP-binding protein
MTMGTRIVVMKDGVIQQVDTPQHIYDHPTNIFVAGFIGSPQMNFIDVKVVEEGSKVILVFGEDRIALPEDKAAVLKKEGYVGKDVIMGIRPEDIDDSDEFIAKHGDTTLEAGVEVTELMGAETYIYLAKEKSNIVARVNGSSKAKAGDTLKIALDASKVHVFDKETEKTVF